MIDSSDEDLNSDDEVIDLRPLWRGKIFLDSDEDDTKASKNLDSDDENDSEAGIDLFPVMSPVASSTPTEEFSPIEAMQKLLDYYNRTPPTESLPMPIPVIRLSNPTAPERGQNARIRPIAAPRTRAFSRIRDTQADDIVNDILRNSYRPNSNPIRRRLLPASFSTSPPRWASVISAAPSAPPGEDAKAAMATNDGEIGHPEERFVLPAAIRAREMACTAKVDETKRADKAVFVSSLILSTLAKRQ